MRHRASPLVLMAAAVLAPLACSLAVSSELDGKPSGSTSTSDGGTADVSEDVLDEQDEQDAPDAPDDVDVSDANEGGGDVGPACLTCPDSCCNGVCADLKNDPLNCGQCDNACLAGRECAHSKCKNGFATVSPLNAPEARLRSCAVWTGSEMFVWGGITPENILLNSGSMYDPKTDTWRDVSLNGAPSPREEPTCVAMNGKVLVWGGVDWSQVLLMQDGAVWDPSTDSWTPLGADGPAPRIRATALWTGTSVLIWGGEKMDGHQEKSGATYDPDQDLWKSMSATGAPAHTKRQAWAWTGSTLYVFGGRDDGGGNVYNDMHSYSPTLNVWLPIVGLTPPSARSNAFATWSGSKFIVWGGLDASQTGLVDGASYNPVTLTWTTLSSVAPPTARGAEMFRSGWSAWLGDQWLIAGGSDVTGVRTDIVTFDPAAADDKAWSAAIPWDPMYAHEWGVGVWSGEEFIVWGGSDGSNPVVGGSRWMP